MARGRFVSKEICIDKKVNSLNDPWSMLAWTWLIAHADVEGRTHGDAAVLKSMVFPRQPQITVEMFEGYILQWIQLGFVKRYSVDDDLYIQLINFEKHQEGLRKDREMKSIIPPDPENYSGNTPEEFRQTSGNAPDEVKLSKEEVKLREVEVKAGEPDSPSEIQLVLEKITGIPPSGPGDIQAMQEIEAFHPLQVDIQAGFDWVLSQGKHIHRYSSLVNPIKIAMAKRVQKPPGKAESVLEHNKRVVAEILQEVENGDT